MTMLEFIFGLVTMVILTIGVVQLIDYERERKWHDRAKREALRHWFNQRMYNYYSYGNVNGSPRKYLVFEDEYPEYKFNPKLSYPELNTYNKAREEDD